MSLVAILTPIHAILVQNGSLQPGAQLELAAMPKRDRTPGPRVTWVPGTDEFKGPDAAVSQSFLQAFHAANPGKQLPRSLGTRLAGVEAHLWNGNQPGSVDDYSGTEGLINAVISAMRHQAYGAYQLRASGWVNPRSSEGNLLGHRYVLNVVWAIPVLEIQDNPIPLPGERTTIQTITPTYQMGPIPPGGTTVNNP
jgi:hypothetical protein